MKLNFPFLVLPLFMSLLLLSCSSESYINLNSLKEQLNLKDFPEQKDYPEADALVLSEVRDVNLSIVNGEFKTKEKKQKVLKLFKNIENYASVEIPIMNGDKISELRARTIRPDGTAIDLQSDEFHTISGSSYDYIFYTDEKKVKFTFPSIEKNCLLEYEYTIDRVFPYYQEEWYVQEEIPKLQDIFKLNSPLVLINKEKNKYGLGVKYKTNNCLVSISDSLNNIDSVVAQKQKNVGFTWEQHNIPAFEPDPMMPPHSNYLQRVEFSPSKWEHWNDFSDWYYNQVYKSQLVITDEISNKAKELIKDCKSEIDEIRSIYKFVQKIRYVAIDVGRTGIVPATPQEVLSHNYGDCKGKSTLLVAFLKSIGITAKPVLVLTADEGHINRDFPSGKFNHVIVVSTTKDGKTFWMDPTVEYCKLGELPSQCENIDVLVLNEDGTSQIETTPTSTYNDNVEEISIKINLANTDSTNYDISVRFKGEYNIDHREYFADKTRIEMLKYCKSLVSDNYLNAKVLDYSISNLDSVDSDLILNFKLNVPNIIERQGGFTFLNADPFQLSGNFDWMANDKRKYDIEFEYPHLLNKTIEVILPENKYNIRNLPPNSINKESGLCYSKNCQIPDSNRIIIKESFSVTTKNINVSDYLKVRKFTDKVKTSQNERIILTTK